MKVAALILLALLGAANATLQDDFNDFMAIIPYEEIKAITLDYAANDSGFQIVLAYLKSDDFAAIIGAVQGRQEWHDFVAWVAESGLDVYGLIEKMLSILGLDAAYEVIASSSGVWNRSFHGWFNEVWALLPIDDLKALAQDKLQNSADFREFYERLASDDFAAIAGAVASTAEWQKLMTKATDHGVDVEKVIAFLAAMFGWV